MVTRDGLCSLLLTALQGLLLSGLPVSLLWLPASAGEPGFAAGPEATREGGKIRVSFTVSRPTDVEVSVLNAKGDVVRSLAAGVLGGKNPPPEPLKPGLAQELTWDGKGDWNLPVGQGPFRIRVRTGMSVKFGRLIGDSPYNFNDAVCRGMAVDPTNGDLYFLGKGASTGTKPLGSTAYFLRVYDRTGKYLREIMPYPADIDAESRKVFGAVSAPGMPSPAPRNYWSVWPSFYPVKVGGSPQYTTAEYFKLMAMDPRGEHLVLLNETTSALYRLRKADGGVVAGRFVEPLSFDRAGRTGLPTRGPVMGAMAPDGDTCYFAGCCALPTKGEKESSVWPSTRIYRKAAGGSALSAFAEAPLPDSWPGYHQGGETPQCQGVLHGLAVDKDGRLLVCDAANGKVWMYTPDGKPAGSLDVPDAYLVVPDGKTGALYIVTRKTVKPNFHPTAQALIKIAGTKPNAKTLYSLQLSSGNYDPFLAADCAGPEPQLWLGATGAWGRRGSLLRIADKGDRFEVLEDLADRAKTAAGFALRLEVDPEADLVYLENGMGVNRRYNGLSGEHAGKVDKDGYPEPISGSEIAIRRDGMIYLGAGVGPTGWNGKWRRLNRDLSPAPLPDGRREFGHTSGRFGACNGNPGACATPDGRLYFMAMMGFRLHAVFELLPDGSPGRCGRIPDLMHPDGQFVKVGLKSALVGWLPDQSGSVAVDQQGHIYAGARVLPRDHKLPGDLASIPLYYGMTGSIIKFAPEGGGLHPDDKPGTTYNAPHLSSIKVKAVVPEKFGPGLPMGPCQGGIKATFAEGAVRAYPGFAPFTGAELNGTHCACIQPRFGLDDHGRLYIPNALTCSVRVVDNEGNEILSFGSYGNFDSQGPGSRVPKPEIPLAYPIAAKPSFKYIYVADSANRRAVRVDPVYAAEAICEVK